jgi:hypothetical protein
MYLQSFVSTYPRLYNPCLHVQMSYKSYKIYSLVPYDTSALGGNDKDHAHAFSKYHTIFLLKLKGLAYPLQYIAQIMDTHSCDGFLSCTLYTRHIFFYPFLYSDSTGMLSSSNLASTLPNLYLYACIGLLGMCYIICMCVCGHVRYDNCV